jgi:hypothetical protein
MEVRADRIKYRELARCLAESVLKGNRSRQVYFRGSELRKDSIDLCRDMIDVGHSIDHL